jgi:uncharacterized protein YjbI with pentapeptide repeats
MLEDFFKLNTPFTKIDVEEFTELLKTSRHIHSVLYRPNELKKFKIKDITFENCSFAKTTIQNVTFFNCVFIDCLFIGSTIMKVEFHDCIFKNCNFFKSNFTSVYAKPVQFKEAITDNKFANIAVHLFQQLRENYHSESQREYKNEAEYYFHYWDRRNSLIQS